MFMPLILTYDKFFETLFPIPYTRDITTYKVKECIKTSQNKSVIAYDAQAVRVNLAETVNCCREKH